MIHAMTGSLKRCAFLLPLLALLLGLPVSAEAGIVAKVSLFEPAHGRLCRRQPALFLAKSRRRGQAITRRSAPSGRRRSRCGTARPSIAARPCRIRSSSMARPIHGSYETRYLGTPASHGCVRLHPAAAAALFSLVRQYGSGNTVIKIGY